MLLKDLKKNTYKGQKIEVWAYPSKKTGFRGIMCRLYHARHIPKKYDNLKVIYWACEYREGLGHILIVDCKE